MSKPSSAPARRWHGHLLTTFLILCLSLVLAVLGFIAGDATGSPASAFHFVQEKQVKPRPIAPDLTGGIEWINSDKAISLEDLKGRVVVLDFWTLCCINCIHTLPDLARLESKYGNVLVVIGVHSPKFEREKKTESILKAVLRYEIKHPVINDADHKIWKKYDVDSWPTLVLIDPEGKIVGYTSGEGNYDTLDSYIGKLVKEFKARGALKDTPLAFKLAREKESSPLYFPGKVVADGASKRVFIADSTNHRIVVTTLEGKKIAIAGSGLEGLKDGTFADARFSDPQGMALDGETLYVADRKNHCIRALNLKDKTVTTVAGIGEQERRSRNSGGPALKVGLNSPWDLLLHDRKIYIAMAGHHQIWTYDPVQKRVAPFAGDGRENIEDGPLPLAKFAQPSGLASDGKTLFVADSEISAIRAVPFDTQGKVTTIVGEGLFEFGDKDGQGDEVRLQHALGVAYQEGKLYVADTYNNKIKVINPTQRTCTTYLGDPPGWVKAKMFNEPGGLCIADGKMYIADTNNHRIQVVDMKTKDVNTLRLLDVEPVRRDPVVAKESK